MYLKLAQDAVNKVLKTGIKILSILRTRICITSTMSDLLDVLLEPCSLKTIKNLIKNSNERILKKNKPEWYDYF